MYSAADVVAEGLGRVLYEREISADVWHPFPDTLPVVEALSDAGVPMVVVSDTGWDIRPVLDRHGLLPYFAGLVLSYEHGVAKPAPQLFSAVCELLGVPAEEALMVGDNALTDGGAIESGIRVYLLPQVRETGLTRSAPCSGSSVSHLREPVARLDDRANAADERARVRTVERAMVEAQTQEADRPDDEPVVVVGDDPLARLLRSRGSRPAVG